MPTIGGLTPEQAGVLERYFREQYESLLRRALFLVRDSGLAEVAVQDTFETAAVRFDAFINSPNPVGWLHQVLYNKVREIRREQRMMLQHFVSLDSVPEQAEEIQPHPVLTDSKNEDVQLLLRFYVEGYSIRELARESGITEGAMKMRLKRARDRLRECQEFLDMFND